LIEDGVTLTAIREFFESEFNIYINEIALKNHYKKMGKQVVDEPKPVVTAERGYDLNNIDFSEYDFDLNKPDSILEYLQKAHLFIYLKQLEIVTREQETYINGITDDPPGYSISKLGQLQKLLDNISGISILADQSAALRKVLLMGYNLSLPGGIESDFRQITNPEGDVKSFPPIPEQTHIPRTME
jgi:hypothetical protein